MTDEELRVKVIADITDVDNKMNQISSKAMNVANTTTSSATQSTTRSVSFAVNEITRAVSQSLGKISPTLSRAFSGAMVAAQGAVASKASGLKNALQIDQIEKDMARLQEKSMTLASAMAKAKARANAVNAKADAAEKVGNVEAATRLRKEAIQSLHAFNASKVVLKETKEELKKLGDQKSQLTELGKGAEGFGDKVKGVFASIKSFIAAHPILAAISAVVVAATAAIKVIKSLINTTKEVAEAGDNIDKLSQRIGFSYEQYQRLGFIMQLCGSSAEGLQKVMTPMVNKIAQIQKGNTEAGAGFEALSVSIYDTNGELRSTADIFDDVITRLQNTKNETEKLALATSIFGRGASQLMPLLNSQAAALDVNVRAYEAVGGYMNQHLVEASARYTDSVALMKASMQGFKNTIAEAVLPVLQAVVKWITLAYAYISSFLRALFGMGQTTKATADSSKKSFGGAAAAASDYGNAINGATAALKELKRQTMGFDELNILTKQDASGGGGTGGGGYSTGLSAGDLDPMGDFEGLLSEEQLAKLENFRKKMEELRPIIHGVGQILAGFGELLGGVLTGNLNAIMKGAAKIGAGISNIAGNESLAQKFEKFVKLPLNEKISAIGKLFSNVASDISKFAGEARDAAVEKFTDLRDAAVQKFNDIKDGVTRRAIEIRDVAVNKFEEVRSKVSDKMSNIKDTVSTKWEEIKSKTSEKLGPLVSTVQTKFDNIKSAISSKIVAAKDTVLDVFNKIKDGIKSKLDTAHSTVVSVIGKIKSAFKFTWSLPQMKLPHFKVSPSGWKIGDLLKGTIPKLSISWYARGGVFDKPTLFNYGNGMLGGLGERGAEAVVPLENNTQWMNVLADKLSERMNNAPTSVVLKIGEKELGWATIGAINNITAQTGELQLQFA